MSDDYQESEDFALSIDIYVDVLVENRTIARMSADWPDDKEVKQKVMRITFYRPGDGPWPGNIHDNEVEGEQEGWTATVRAVTRIMEEAQRLIGPLEERLRKVGREAWEGGNDPQTDELFGYK